MGGLTGAAFTDRLGVVLTLVIALSIGTVILEVGLYFLLTKILRLRNALAYTLLAPAVIALTVFTLYPLLYNIQLAFSDLRLRTLPCYAVQSATTAPCPLGALEANKPANVEVDRLELHVEPGDTTPVVGEVTKGTTITVLQSGKVAAAAGAEEDKPGGLDLGGVKLPGQGGASDDEEDEPAAPADTRTWWQIKSGDLIGWVPQTIERTETLRRDPVLYSIEYGLRNFRDVFFQTDPQTGAITGWGRLIRTENSTFPVLLARTALWTVLNVIFHLLIGFGLALILNTNIRFKNIYRLIILIPWAVPQVIAGLTWRTEFQAQYGFVNQMIGQFGIEPISWLRQPVPAFIAVLFVNVWLGVPFYMVVLTGGLGSISREYYEAAEIDGANVVQRFRAITVPLIRPIAVPIITLDAIWTFNQFNVIYLITEGEPNESTNILVTALYNAAFGRNGTFQLGFAAAFSILIFLILLGMATVWVRSSGALEGIYD